MLIINLLSAIVGVAIMAIVCSPTSAECLITFWGLIIALGLYDIYKILKDKL